MRTCTQQLAAAPAATCHGRHTQQQRSAPAVCRPAASAGRGVAALSAARPASAAPPARRMRRCCAAAAPPAADASAAAEGERKAPMKVVIAGGGIGGLVLAVGLLKRGFDVTVLERDMTAIRGEGKYRGPIQVRLSAPGTQGSSLGVAAPAAAARPSCAAADHAAGSRSPAIWRHAPASCTSLLCIFMEQHSFLSRVAPLCLVPLRLWHPMPLTHQPQLPPASRRSSPTRSARWRRWTRAWRTACTRRAASPATASTASATA